MYDLTEEAQSVVDRAKGYAKSAGGKELSVEVMVRAMVHEHPTLLTTALGLAQNKAVTSPPPAADDPPRSRDPMRASRDLRDVLDEARSLAQRTKPATSVSIAPAHLACALARSPKALDVLKNLWSMPLTPLEDEAALKLLRELLAVARESSLARLTERLAELRAELLRWVFGQDHAVDAFVDGLFRAEVLAESDADRRAPRAVFVFAGPPGVGKTYLAEFGASLLGRTVKRFDMSGFASPFQQEGLVGMPKNYQGAHPGPLTELVRKHPDAVLLFDEIEKAHVNTIQLFLQLLDAGQLEDKFHEQNVSFRDTTIIFTTNVGKKIYDRPNETGVHGAHDAFHRQTVLDALRTEKDPRTGEPVFPAALCSRLGTGQVVLFNHLGLAQLERVARTELERTAALFGAQHGKVVTFDESLPMCLVLREGARADARTLRAQAQTFLKSEVFKLCELLGADQLRVALQEIDSIRFVLDDKESPGVLNDLLASQAGGEVLLVADPEVAEACQAAAIGIGWRVAATAEAALDVLAQHEPDLVLLDLTLGRSGTPASVWDTQRTIDQFGRAPLSARSFARGQETLRRIRERRPDAAVFLLWADASAPVEAEWLVACVRAGGARGVLVLSDEGTAEPPGEGLGQRLLTICRELRREAGAARLLRERKALVFDTAPLRGAGEVTIRLRNLRLTRALAAADAGEVLEEVERPATRFADVIGAEAAKEELGFFVDYLKNPQFLAAQRVRPPAGLLLHGPPGTGKTMLARAMAGESDVAFLVASASAFVTVWQGSGPQNIRDLFARARRYAPAIVFIDEIDSIGAVRTGSPGAGQSAEGALTALLTEMDGFATQPANRPVFVLAATNFRVDAQDGGDQARTARSLDPALVRRFARRILVDLPDRAARTEFLRRRCMDLPRANVDQDALTAVAQQSMGMSFADLETVVDAAVRAALRTGGAVTGALLEAAFGDVRFGTARQRAPAAMLRTAQHESGHTIMYWLAGWLPSYVTIVSRGSHGGYMAPAADDAERRDSRTRRELLAEIRVCLGGRAAELICHGADDGLSSGASSDLQAATRIAQDILCRYGMDEDFGLVATPELMGHPSALASPAYARLLEQANSILREQMAQTLDALRAHRRELDLLAKTLGEKERLDAGDVMALLGPPPV